MLNKVTIIGLLGADPEIRTVDANTKVARIRVATTESWRDKQTGERKSVTEWHSVELWSSLADVAEKYLKKGAQVYIEGKIQTREYEKDGHKHYATNIRANELKMLDRKVSEKPTTCETEPAEPVVSAAYQSSDDLPF